MALDIGIDLGTATVQVFTGGKIVLSEPSVIAINKRDGSIVAVGNEAQTMIGRTPSHIVAIKPLENGVIAEIKSCQKMIKYFVEKACSNRILRPRVAICIPTEITEVERQAVVEAADAAGAKNVITIEEPMAAAIGAGIDVLKPDGNLVLDIGGGTADIAVITLGGISKSVSLKIAGNTFDDTIIKAIRAKYALIIGSRMAEKIKISLPDAIAQNEKISVKGKNALTGLPEMIEVDPIEVKGYFDENFNTIVDALVGVIDKTPPELVSDISENGIYLTGGGALVCGLSELIEKRTGIKTIFPEHPDKCVVMGAGRAFEFLGKLQDGLMSERKL
ncbi:MAG: rod shape-determining protein [Oscillospiraceae bacterium]|nr:rod shape-determining protein [Oscillospiraceae bacterium]